MGKFGAQTPKRHRLWGNDRTMLEDLSLKAGYMAREEQAACVGQTAKQYCDSSGRKRMVGIKPALTASQTLCFEIDFSPPHRKPNTNNFFYILSII